MLTKLCVIFCYSFVNQGTMDIRYVYFTGDESFQLGDKVKVLHKKSFENEIKEDKGVILSSVLTSELRLDCSQEFHSKIIEIDLRDIIEIEKL